MPAVVELERNLSGARVPAGREIVANADNAGAVAGAHQGLGGAGGGAFVQRLAAGGSMLWARMAAQRGPAEFNA